MKEIRGFDEKAFCKSALIQHIKNIYTDFENERPSKKSRVRTNTVVPSGEIPQFRSYMDVREFLLTNTKNAKGKQLMFEFEGSVVGISTYGKPYWAKKDSMADLTFDEAGRLYKTLFNYKFILEEALAGESAK